MKKKLLNFYDENLDRYLKILKEWVTTNSFTANIEGVNHTARLIANTFAALGFQAEYIQSANPNYGSHLVLMRSGTSNRKVGLITHLDTVFPPEEEIANQFTWRIEGDKIYGPGTNDIKGGTVMILMVLEGLKRFAEELFNETTWIILANAAEERWSEDFGDLCRQKLREEAIAALVFEAGYVDEHAASLVTARKGMAIYDIHVEGKSAHAGNGHQSGANALVQMAKIVQAISELTDYQRDLTYNIGVLNGGTVPNRVPHTAFARGEMRTFSEDVFTQGIHDLLQINDLPALSSDDGTFTCKFNVELILKSDPWPRNDKTDHLFTIWKQSAETLGITIIREERGGLSDGNQLWDFTPTIDGLGPSGMNAHCSERSDDGSKDQEFVTRSSFPIKAVLNTIAIQTLLNEG